MVEYSEYEFETRLAKLTDTRRAIQSLTTWCMERHENHLNMIFIWTNVIKKVNVEKRLALFYLANDVIQSSKSVKCDEFVTGWAPAIESAIPYVKDERIQSKILRIIKIWRERVIYDNSYLSNLTALLTTPIQKLECTDPIQESQVHTLAAKVHSYVKSKRITDISMKTLRDVHLPLNIDEDIEDILKDSTRYHQIINELKYGQAKIDSCIKSLQHETSLRAHLLHVLEVATSKNAKKNEEGYLCYTDQLKLEKSNADSMCINGPISLYSINTPSHSASAVSVYNLSLQNLSYENTLNTEKYLINSMEKNNNNTKTIVPTAIVANQNHVNHRTKSIITSDSHNTNQACNETMNSWSTNDCRALPSSHRKMADHSIISKTDSQQKQNSKDLNSVHNTFPCKRPQHDPTKKDQLKGNVRPKLKKSNFNCTRSPRHFNQYSRPSSRWN